MNKFLELITVPIAAGGQSRFELSGDYFEIIDSAYPVTVLLEDRNGAQIGRMSGAEASYFLRDTPYTAMTIASEQAQTVRIAFGSGEAGNRRTAGVVQVVDGEKNRTIAGVQFVGVAAIAGVAGQFAHTQIWNPPGSGKNLVIGQIIGSAGAPSQINIGRLNSPLAILMSGVSENKKIGGPVTTSEIRTQNSAAILPANSFSALFVEANAPFTWLIKGGFVVPPGFGFTCFSNNVAISQIVNFEWFEEKI